jgi:hypothetical protein
VRPNPQAVSSLSGWQARSENAGIVHALHWRNDLIFDIDQRDTCSLWLEATHQSISVVSVQSEHSEGIVVPALSEGIERRLILHAVDSRKLSSA